MTDPRIERPAILYVGGTGRSGSTMLAGALGEVPGLVSVGEVRFVWQRGILEDRLCGCGSPFSGCAFWASVLDRALGPASTTPRAPLATRLHAELERRTRLRTVPAHLVHRGDPRHRADREVVELDAVLGAVYRAIAEVSGSPVVVDSSKLPTYAAVLSGLPAVDLRVAHLVRDPRAAAHSWRRRKLQPDLGPGAFMERRGATKSALLWAVWNRSLEALVGRGSYTRLTYEEFLSDPPGRSARLLRDLGLPGDVESVFTDPDVVRMSEQHTVAGNPSRHQQGLVRLVPDHEWRAEMSGIDRGVVTALTWPVLLRYGYSLRS